MLILTVILISAAGSVLPFSPIEPFLLALPFMAPRNQLVPLALLAAVAHMAGKVALFYGSERLMRLMPPARREAMDRARERLDRRPLLRNVTLFVSACAGFPPFYALTIVAAALRIPAAAFIWIGLAGRSVRFVALVLLPHLFTG